MIYDLNLNLRSSLQTNLKFKFHLKNVIKLKNKAETQLTYCKLYSPIDLTIEYIHYSWYVSVNICGRLQRHCWWIKWPHLLGEVLHSSQTPPTFAGGTDGAPCPVGPAGDGAAASDLQTFGTGDTDRLSNGKLLLGAVSPTDLPPAWRSRARLGCKEQTRRIIH